MNKFILAIAVATISFGCAMTPKHGNRGPASVKADPNKPAAACECSLGGGANCPAK